jgi:hypothetical protein
MSHTGSIQGTNWANLRSDEVSGNDSLCGAVRYRATADGEIRDKASSKDKLTLPSSS